MKTLCAPDILVMDELEYYDFFCGICGISIDNHSGNGETFWYAHILGEHHLAERDVVLNEHCRYVHIIQRQRVLR